ncbi:hypothetical protein L1049_009540 [Liquidambar formosana]|uniref:Uncharacterized protein n=1 Tax=Liquidambar formosana TaxID=63359 RepID=A0AAP0R679_LIQFO
MAATTEKISSSLLCWLSDVVDSIMLLPWNRLSRDFVTLKDSKFVKNLAFVTVGIRAIVMMVGGSAPEHSKELVTRIENYIGNPPTYSDRPPFVQMERTVEEDMEQYCKAANIPDEEMDTITHVYLTGEVIRPANFLWDIGSTFNVTNIHFTAAFMGLHCT